MNVLDFTSKRFNEIQDQDNPVFQTTNYHGEHRRIKECIMVCKVASPKHDGVGEGFVVIHVPISGEIVKKGRFWKLDMAMAFADVISEFTMQYSE